MNTIRSYLQKIDVFGVPYSFKYKNKDKYMSATGGLFVFLFIGVTIFIGIYYFIPFYNRKNYTTVYYTLKLDKTETVNFGESETAFAIGLNCFAGSDGTVATDLLRVDHKYIYYKLEEEYVKNTSMLGVHKCTKHDFYNRYDETFDGSGIYDYQCLDDNSKGIEGIYTSPIFAYYEFDVYAKNNSKKLLDKITNYLTENDCKLQIFYSDNTVDISNYNDPIKSYVEAIFIQLNPTLSIRRNIYFMNQYLFDDNYLFWVFGDDTKASSKKTLFSKFEEYSLFQGINRDPSSSDYLNYAKVYIRADTKRTDVKRKYQKVMEFYADASSLLIALYEVLLIIFNYINNFWAEQTLSKKLFFFKDLEESGLSSKKISAQINELLEITNENQNQDKLSPKNTVKESDFDENKEESKKIDPETHRVLKNEEIKIYRTKKGRNNPQNLIKKEKGKEANKIKRRIRKDNDNNIRFKGKKENNRDDLSNNSNSKGRDSISSLNLRYNKNTQNRINFNYNNIEFREIPEDQIEKISYDFNIIEVFGACFCNCCQSKRLQIKNNLNEKANSILNSKLDIVLFVRNMLLIDIINEIFFGDNEKDIVNFLSRPIISLKGKKKNDQPIFYHNYESSDFNKFYVELSELAKKSDKRKEEEQLISISNNHLKSLLI